MKLVVLVLYVGMDVVMVNEFCFSYCVEDVIYCVVKNMLIKIVI